MSSDQREYVGVAVPVEEALPEFCKIGGLPLGFTPDRWPTCGECSRPLDFYFALDLQQPRKIAHTYRWAYFFFCNGYYDEPNGRQCNPYYPDSGANRIVLLKDRDTVQTTAYPGPKCQPEYTLEFYERNELEEERKRVSNEVWKPILDPDPDCDPNEDVFIELPKFLSTPVHLLNKPGWIQNDATPTCPKCSGPTKFIAQVEESFGVIYAFLCREECSRESSYLMWQC